jgi:hypothetical protein
VRACCHYSDTQGVNRSDLDVVGGTRCQFSDLEDPVCRILTNLLTAYVFKYTGNLVIDHDSVAEDLVTTIKLRRRPSN